MGTIVLKKWGLWSGVVLAISAGVIFVALVTHKSSPKQPSKQTTSHPDTTPPSVAMNDLSQGQTVSGTITVQPTVTDDRGVVRVEYYIDGVFWGVSYSPPFRFEINTTKLINGPHKIIFKAYDKAGNEATTQLTITVDNPEGNATGEGAVTQNNGSPSAVSQRRASVATETSSSPSSSSQSGGGSTPSPDTSAPSTPTNLVLSADDGYTAQLNWTASTDNKGGTGYKIFRDGTQIGTANTHSYSDVTVAPGNTYVYKVVAYDAAGNSSGFSAEPSIALVGTSIWINGDTPSNFVDDTGSIELGVKFKPRVDGQVKGVRFYKMAGDTGTHTGTLWQSNGTPLATVTFSGETASGWQDASFSTPVEVTANTTYVVSYFNPDAKYAYSSDYFKVGNGGITSEYLSAPGSGGADGSNGVYNTGAGFPSSSFGDTNYWVDVSFAPVKGSSGPSAKLADSSKVYSGYPGSDNTGLPVGKRLPRRDRSIDVWQPNTTVDNIEVTVTNAVNIHANNATVRNTRVAATLGAANTWAVRQDTGVSGLIVEDSEFYGTPTQQMQYGINDAGSDLTVRRVNISCYGNGIQSNQNVVLEDSFVHDPCYFAGDHTDAFISTGGDTYHISHNTLHNTQSQTAALGFFCDFSAIANATVDNNLLIGGGYAVYAGSTGTGNCTTSHDNKFTNNKFSREVWPNGGANGPVNAYTALSGNVWTNNTWYDDGTPVNP